MREPWLQLARLVAARVLASVAAFLSVSALLFVGTESLPGDFASASAGRFATPEEVSEIRFTVGLYQPALERYFAWLGGLVQGDLGRSWTFDKTIAELLGSRLPNSLLLAAYAALLSVPLGFALGVLAIVWRDSPFDRGVNAGAIATLSLPDFVIAYALLFILAVQFDLFPAFTIFRPGMSLADWLHGAFLPAASLATVSVAPILRLTRANLLNVLAAPYIEMAHLKGLSPTRIVLRHALPNAIGPIANVVMIVLANLIVSIVVIETIFAYPGIGHLMITGVGQRDLPLVLACGLVFAGVFLLLHLIADLIALISNPRLLFPLEGTAGGGLTFRPLSGRAAQRFGAACLAVVVAAGALVLFIREPTDQGSVATLPGAADLQVRDRLQKDAMLEGRGLEAGLVSFAYFLPIGQSDNPLDQFEGRLSFAPVEIRRRSTRSSGQGTVMTFPGFSTEVVVAEGRLIPRDRNLILTSKDSSWEIVLSAGRAWSEPDDGDWSRASFPFTLIHPQWASSLNGAATFLFRRGQVSDLYLQIAQEAVPGAKADIWGHGPLGYRPYPLLDGAAMIEAYDREVASRLRLRPWHELEEDHDPEVLSEFDGRFNHENISASALLVDGVLYHRGCRTRYGPYPYCAEMRHAVYSVSKSLGAAIGLLRLAEKYGEEVLDARIVDYLALTPKHDGWAQVTFRDALNMATGIGNVTPVEVDHYVEADSTALAFRIDSVRETGKKLALISSFRDYPWGPGKVFRYRTSDTFTLAAAMDGFIKSREGPGASLTALLHDEVFEPLGIARLPITHSLGRGGKADVPQLGFGMVPTLDEAARLAILLQKEGRWGETQILHRTSTREATDMTRRQGLATGWTYENGTRSYYDMSFWRVEFEPRDGCRVFIPAMAGIGGNYILLMPRGLIGFRFADGGDGNPGTWDNSHIRLVADHVRPFCE